MKLCSKVEATIQELFVRLRQMNLRYAVLRNYENYPDFGHDIDLVLHQDDLPSWNDLIVSLAQDFNWAWLIECSHWNTSSQPHHNIQIYRLLDHKTPAHLQIDLFHGYLIGSFPLMSEEELLSDSLFDERGFQRIHPNRENFFRLLQLHSLYVRQPQGSPKSEAYRKKILDYEANLRTIFSNYLQIQMGRRASRVLAALKQGNTQEYISQLSSFKKNEFLKRVLNSPHSAIKNTFYRSMDYLLSYWLKPCGQRIRAFGNTEKRRQLQEVLDTFCACNILPKWKNLPSKKAFSWSDQLILERGGIVIQWVNQSSKADLNLESLSETELKMVLLKKLVQKHRLLYQAEMVYSL